MSSWVKNRWNDNFVTSFDAVVFNKNGRIYAKDAFGNLIDSGVYNTDDSRVFQSAITYVHGLTYGGVLLLKTGNYLVMMVAAANNVEVVGEGWGKTILAAYDDGNPSHWIFGETDSSGAPLTNFALRNLEIDGTNQNRSSYNVAGKGVNNKYCLRCKWDKLFIHNTPATGLGVDMLQDCEISDCLIVSCGTSGQTSGSNGIGIGVGQFSREKLIVSNCVVRNCADNNYILESQASQLGVGEYVFNGCISESAGNAGFAFNGVSGAIGTNCNDYGSNISYKFSNNGTPASSDCVLTNCRSISAVTSGISISDETSDGIVIEGCKVKLAGQNGIVLRGTNITCIGNHSTDNGQNGIYDLGSTTARVNHVISNNQVLRNSTSGSGSYHGIKIDVSATNITNLVCKGNNCSDNSGTPKQAYGIVVVTGASTGLVDAIVEGNELIGNVTGKFAMLSGIDTASAIVKDNYGYNPIGSIANMLNTSLNIFSPYNLTGGASAPVASTAYLVAHTDIILTVSGGTGVSISIKDGAGNVISSGLSTLTRERIPRGFKVDFGGFSVAPTVSAWFV